MGNKMNYEKEEVTVKIEKLKSKMFDDILEKCLDEDRCADEIVVDVLRDWDIISALYDLDQA